MLLLGAVMVSGLLSGLWAGAGAVSTTGPTANISVMLLQEISARGGLGRLGRVGLRVESESLQSEGSATGLPGSREGWHNLGVEELRD